MSLRDASCCIDDVMKGGEGCFFLVPFLTEYAVYSAPSSLARYASLCSLFSILTLPFSSPVSEAVKVLRPELNFASIDQYSSGTKFLISFSLSTTIFNAAD